MQVRIIANAPTCIRACIADMADRPGRGHRSTANSTALSYSATGKRTRRTRAEERHYCVTQAYRAYQSGPSSRLCIRSFRCVSLEPGTLSQRSCSRASPSQASQRSSPRQAQTLQASPTTPAGGDPHAGRSPEHQLQRHLGAPRWEWQCCACCCGPIKLSGCV
jgi:hypothetical protein